MVLVRHGVAANPDVRVFMLDTRLLPGDIVKLFQRVRERYRIAVEFEYPEKRRRRRDGDRSMART